MKRWATVTAWVLAVGFPATAAAEIVIPASARLEAPVAAPRVGGVCGRFVDLLDGPNPHDLANQPFYMSMVDDPLNPSVSYSGSFALSSLDVADHGNGCVANGDVPGGAAWPVSFAGAYAAARFRGFLNVTGEPGQPVIWTLGAQGNDSVDVLIDGVRVLSPNWEEFNWKQYRWVEFEQPGVYPIEIRWVTNHVCGLDPLEVTMAPRAIPNYDGLSCASVGMLAESCVGLIPTSELAVLAAPYLIAGVDGEAPNHPSDDADGDGISDADEDGSCGGWRNTDGNTEVGDIFPDHLDADSDGDGLGDAEEAGDADLTTPPVDSDGDGTANFRDLDSDGDGVCDGVATDGLCVSGPDLHPTDGERCADIDADGCDDCALTGVDGLAGSTVFDGEDSDHDGICDTGDIDDDNDAIADLLDLCPHAAGDTGAQADADGDGSGDRCDSDRDGDGLANAVDNCADRDNPDQLDRNGNGIGDACDGAAEIGGGGCNGAADNGSALLAFALGIMAWGASTGRRSRSARSSR